MNLKQFIQNEGITQAQLAQAYGCKPGPMSQFVNGHRPVPVVKMAQALAKVIGRPVTVRCTIEARPGEEPQAQTEFM